MSFYQTRSENFNIKFNYDYTQETLALINNNIYVMDKEEFMQRVASHENSEYINSYFIQYGVFDSKLSSVAIVLTSDNFVAVGVRSLTFAWSHISSKLSKAYYGFRKKKIAYNELRDVFMDCLKFFERISPSELELLNDHARLKKSYPHISNCFKLFGFPLVTSSNHQYKDLVLFGGHPNKDEEMISTVMREVSEESNIQNCSEIIPIGTLYIHDHRFQKDFTCNLFLYKSSDTKNDIKNNFRQNGEISDISFTLVRKTFVFPLEIIKHCLD